MKSSVKIGGSILIQGYTSDFDVAATISEKALPLLADGIVNKLLSPGIFEADATLTDLKGARPLRTGWEDTGEPANDELLLIEGEYIPETDQEQDEKEEEEQDLGFALELTTTFKEFKGDHIVHSVAARKQGAVFADISPYHLGRTPSVSIHHLRLSLSIFEISFVGAILGSVPGERYTLTLDAAPNELSVLCHSRKMRRKDANPFDLHPKLRAFSEILRETSGVNVRTMYTEAYKKLGT